MNREQWLTDATDLMRERFFNSKLRLPDNIRLSCGIPAGKLSAIGQCWSPHVSKDGSTHIFICPTLDEPIQVMGTLLHELVHASIGNQHAHNHYFQRVAYGFGLAGKATATYVPTGTELYGTLCGFALKLGDYPHKAMRKTVLRPKKQRPKRVKVVSARDSSYEFTVLLDQLEKGLPIDPWGDPMIIKGTEDA